MNDSSNLITPEANTTGSAATSGPPIALRQKDGAFYKWSELKYINVADPKNPQFYLAGAEEPILYTGKQDLAAEIAKLGWIVLHTQQADDGKKSRGWSFRARHVSEPAAETAPRAFRDYLYVNPQRIGGATPQSVSAREGEEALPHVKVRFTENDKHTLTIPGFSIEEFYRLWEGKMNALEKTPPANPASFVERNDRRLNFTQRGVSVDGKDYSL